MSAHFLSIALGSGLAITNAVVGYVLFRKAMQEQGFSFVKKGLGGMVLRMVCVLALLVVILKVAPINLAAFITSFIVVMLFSLAIKVIALRRASQA